MYEMKVRLYAPDLGDEYDMSDTLVHETKHSLHKAESMFMRELDKLVKITEKELKDGVKQFPRDGTEATVFFQVDIAKDGSDFSGYMFRWPNQTAAARDYLNGVFDAMMDESGHGKKKEK